MVVQDGWIYHTLGTPSDFAAALNKFGLSLEDSKPPIDIQLSLEIQRTEIYGNYEPQLSPGNMPGNAINQTFQPVNGLPWYWMLGKVTLSGIQECGLSSKVDATETGLATTTQYYFKVNIDLGGVVEYDITTASDTTFAAVIILMNAELTGAAFSLMDGNLRCTSEGTSIALSAGTTGTDLFTTLTGFTAFDTAIDNLKNISIMDGLSRKPRLGIYSETPDIKQFMDAHVIGNFNWDYSSNRIKASLIGKGQDHGTTGDTPTSFSYPDDVSTPYNVPEFVKWDDHEINITRFSSQQQQNLVGFIGSTGKNEEISEFAPIYTMYTVQGIASDGDALWADFLAKTPRTFAWKFLKAGDLSKHIRCGHANSYIKSCVPTRIYTGEIVWTFTIEGGVPTMEVSDGLAISFYNLS